MQLGYKAVITIRDDPLIALDFTNKLGDVSVKMDITDYLGDTVLWSKEGSLTGLKSISSIFLRLVTGYRKKESKGSKFNRADGEVKSLSMERNTSVSTTS